MKKVPDIIRTEPDGTYRGSYGGVDATSGATGSTKVLLKEIEETLSGTKRSE